MPDGLNTYKSTLTPQEVDEAFRNIGKVQESVNQAAGYAQTAEQYGTIVQKNQTAIQAIEDNLTDIQGASQNATDAKNAAASAVASSTSAERSAEAAENAAEHAQQSAYGALGWYSTLENLQATHPTGTKGQWAIIGSDCTIRVWDTESDSWVSTLDEPVYINIAGQLSNYDSIFSMPFTGIAKVHRKAKTVDLFFGAVVEGEPSSRPVVYNYLTLKNICAQIGASGLSFSGAYNVITIYRNNLDTGVLGRAGFKFNPQPDNVTGGIARIYSADLSLPGTWSLSDGSPGAYNVIRQGDNYNFFIIGAKML